LSPSFLPIAIIARYTLIFFHSGRMCHNRSNSDPFCLNTLPIDNRSRSWTATADETFQLGTCSSDDWRTSFVAGPRNGSGRGTGVWLTLRVKTLASHPFWLKRRSAFGAAGGLRAPATPLGPPPYHPPTRLHRFYTDKTHLPFA
jgi:hypothetical protein